MLVSKYNASGNDFVIFHTFLKADRSNFAVKICDRQNGIGADGLIVILPYDDGIRWEFYNSDGSSANMCGNGSRAAFLYAYKNALINKSSKLLTGAGLITGDVDENSVEVELTSPKILSKDSINEFDKEWFFYDTGVPHLVHFTQNLDKFDLNLAKHLRHKYNANINFAKFENGSLKVRTYERGVEDETLACGTGMAACFYGAVLNLHANKILSVYPKSGEELQLRLENEKIYFKGNVKHCFDVSIEI
ncbi:diaminopimelate epimerase [Campylobacter sp. RM12920]|uniref:Diaminopimelate epimerase n=1 Tax=Campylobacter californiensis TaxID=1032243 RepID=A0ABD4JKK6_9BACT|nr:diaminopimelate epimerase [Campylobacter sp. RM12919]MBE2988524.1 diaminopimelate epimerase [Campylobacter sp. RM12920]